SWAKPRVEADCGRVPAGMRAALLVLALGGVVLPLPRQAHAANQDPGLELTLLSIFSSPASAEARFHAVADVAVGPDTMLYVLDPIALRVQVYSSQGEYVRSIGTGRRGAVCGRFLAPKLLSVTDNGSIAVFDGED